MGILNRTKKKQDDKVAKPVVEKKSTGQGAVSTTSPAPTVRQAKAAADVHAQSRAYRVLLKPLVTEKAAMLGTHRQYVFAVEPTTNKIEVKKAIHAVYGVEPQKVMIQRRGGKYVRSGRVSGMTKDWKKAIVTLKPGDQIEVYEGV